MEKEEGRLEVNNLAVFEESYFKAPTATSKCRQSVRGSLLAAQNQYRDGVRSINSDDTDSNLTAM